MSVPTQLLRCFAGHSPRPTDRRTRSLPQPPRRRRIARGGRKGGRRCCGGGGGKQQFLCVVGVLRSFVGLATKWIADSRVCSSTFMKVFCAVFFLNELTVSYMCCRDDHKSLSLLSNLDAMHYREWKGCCCSHRAKAHLGIRRRRRRRGGSGVGRTGGLNRWGNEIRQASSSFSLLLSLMN